MRPLLATSLLLAASAAAQAPPDLAERWLLDRCDTGQDPALPKLVREHRVSLEPIFLEAAQNGPPKKMRDEAEKIATGVFARRRERLKTPEGLGLDREAIERARKVTQREFVAQAQSDFDLSYRGQAIAGLGITAGDAARQLLVQIAADPKNPLQSTAKLALDAFGQSP